MNTKWSLLLALGIGVGHLGCTGRAPGGAVIGLDSSLGESRTFWKACFREWGLAVREGALLLDPSSADRAALWIVAARAEMPVNEKTIAALVRYVWQGGRLLCVVEDNRIAERNSEEAWINRFGARIGFKVLRDTTRKPRNMAPELLGDIREIRRTTWAAAELRLTEPGTVLISDEDGRPMAVHRDFGRGRVIVVGHPALLAENPELTRNMVFHLAQPGG